MGCESLWIDDLECDVSLPFVPRCILDSELPGLPLPTCVHSPVVAWPPDLLLDSDDRLSECLEDAGTAEFSSNELATSDISAPDEYSEDVLSRPVTKPSDRPVFNLCHHSITRWIGYIDNAKTKSPTMSMTSRIPSRVEVYGLSMGLIRWR